VSRGIGRIQRAVLEYLSTCGPATLVELRGVFYGWRRCGRGIVLEGRPGRWAPTGDDKSLRRGLAGLLRRGLVIEAGGSRRAFALAATSSIELKREQTHVLALAEANFCGSPGEP
jgi:hypothetical protein